MRIVGLCGLIFIFTAFGSDGAPPVVSERTPPPVSPFSSYVDSGGVSFASSESITNTSPLLQSMNDVVSTNYRYVLIHLGPMSVTKRSLALAITFTSLAFSALQSASLCLVTTPPERMALALGRFMSPLGLLGLPVKELVLTVLLSLRFMATVFEEARNLCLGLASRGIDWSLLGGQGTLLLALRTSSRLFSTLLARCENIAVAMCARGFLGPEKHVVYVEESKKGRGGETMKVWAANGVALMVLAGLFVLTQVSL